MSVEQNLFEVKGDNLYIQGHKVIKAWESFNGWYWFGVEKSYTQDSVIDDKVYPNDQIWYGYVQGLVDEWGYFSEAELSLIPTVWEIPRKNLPWSGRRS